MKRAEFVIAVVFAMACMAMGQVRSFRGTVVRMKMSECTRQVGFVSAMSGTQVTTTQACPEYTVVTDKVVYVLVGRKPEAFIPLAENVLIRIRKSDVVVMSGGEKNESHFAVLQMTLREDWDRDKQHREVVSPTVERNVAYDRNPARTTLIQTTSH